MGLHLTDIPSDHLHYREVTVSRALQLSQERHLELSASLNVSV